MRYFIYTLIILTTFSCHTYKVFGEKFTISEKVKLHEGRFHTFFKDRVLANCIEKIYQQDSSALRGIIFGTWMTTEYKGGMDIDDKDYAELRILIDSTSSAFVKKRFPDFDYETFELPVLSICVYFRNSKQLDSMAVSLYRKYKIRHRQKHSLDWLKEN
jgi:hypothetical protein